MGNEHSTLKINPTPIKTFILKKIDSFTRPTTRVLSVSFSPDGKSIVSGSDDEQVRIWSVESGDARTLKGHSYWVPPWQVPHHDNWVTSVSFSPDGQWIASGSGDSTVKVWSLESGECVTTLRDHSLGVTSVSFSPDGKFIASGSEDRTVKVWSVESGECVKTLKGHRQKVQSVSFSRDGKYIASGTGTIVVLDNDYEDNTVRVWNVESGECVKTLEGHSDRVNSVSFSPDGQWIASGSKDKTVRVWSVESGECVSLEGHSRPVNSVSFSPDGLSIVSGSWDKTVRVWNLDTLDVTTLEGHSDLVLSVSFSPNGKSIVSGSRDGIINIWGEVDEYATTRDWVTTPFVAADNEKVVCKLKF
jgi:WD40 repeat protein